MSLSDKIALKNEKNCAEKFVASNRQLCVNEHQIYIINFNS